MKRPNGYREPTDAEMQCLPEGTLVLTTDRSWQPSGFVGEDVTEFTVKCYAVPITEQEEVTQGLRRTLLDEFAMAALSLASDDEHRSPCGKDGEVTYKSIATRAYLYADAMLAARKEVISAPPTE